MKLYVKHDRKWRRRTKDKPTLRIPCRDTKEVSLHGHGDASMLRDPATLRNPAVEATLIETTLSLERISKLNYGETKV